jgi:hypothetical protein
MILGFIGGRKGQTVNQNRVVASLIQELQPSEAHHGDSIGCEAQFHVLCVAQRVPTVLHPSETPNVRANSRGARLVLPEKPHLERARDVIDASDVVVICVQEEKGERLHSGNWAAARMCRRIKKPFVIVRPSGKVQKERLP